MATTITPTTAVFDDLPKDKEGLVFLGAGGNPQKWIDGVTNILKKKKIAPDDYAFEGALVLKTSEGRTDLCLLLAEGVNAGRLALWRLEFGDCSWLSDYLVNYRGQHATPGGEK